MQVVPIISKPAQTLSVQLGEQDCSLSIYTLSTGLYMDLTVNSVQILQTMICLDRVGLVRFPYLGFVGQLVFIDTEGTDDPVYTGLGTRFVLAYIS